MNTQQVIEGQFDLFGGTPAPQVISQATQKPAPAAHNPRASKHVPDAGNIFEKPVAFDATGWYGTPDTLSKLDRALAALAPGDKWINGHGVTEVYLGLTVGGHQLHRGPEGEHIYAKRAPAAIPMKQYRPTLDNGMAIGDFVLKEEAHLHSSDMLERKHTPPAKYQQGDNCWTGRGRKPLWVIQHLEAGGKLEELAVKHD